MGTEIELRFALDPSRARAIARDARLAGTPLRQRMTSVYFDTPERALARARAGLRLRRTQGGWVQTFKCESADGAEHRRGEWECAVARRALDISALAATPMGAWFANAGHREALAPVFETRVTRDTWRVEAHGGLIEAALDRGRVVAGDRSEPLLELELELLDGPADALFEFALALNRDHAIPLEPRSKAARGFALLAGEQRTPARARRPRLSREASTEQAFVAIAWSCLSQLVANAHGVGAGGDPEYVHQARVALRRLRAALTSFRRAIPREASAPIAAGARLLAAALGEERDIDVFACDTLGPLKAAGGAACLEALAEAMQAARARARRRSADAVAPPAFTRYILEVSRWLEAAAWRPADLDAPAADGWLRRQARPVRRHAARTLERRHRALLASPHAPSLRSPEERHALRIALKKLRYAADALAPLFEVRADGGYLEALAELQEALGTLNDLATGRDLVAGLVAQAGCTPAVEAARALIVGWQAGREVGALREADRAWVRLADAERFW